MFGLPLHTFYWYGNEKNLIEIFVVSVICILVVKLPINWGIGTAVGVDCAWPNVFFVTHLHFSVFVLHHFTCDHLFSIPAAVIDTRSRTPYVQVYNVLYMYLE